MIPAEYNLRFRSRYLLIPHKHSYSSHNGEWPEDPITMCIVWSPNGNLPMEHTDSTYFFVPTSSIKYRIKSEDTGIKSEDLGIKSEVFQKPSTIVFINVFSTTITNMMQ